LCEKKISGVDSNHQQDAVLFTDSKTSARSYKKLLGFFFVATRYINLLLASKSRISKYSQQQNIFLLLVTLEKKQQNSLTFSLFGFKISFKSRNV